MAKGRARLGVATNGHSRPLPAAGGELFATKGSR